MLSGAGGLAYTSRQRHGTLDLQLVLDDGKELLVEEVVEDAVGGEEEEVAVPHLRRDGKAARRVKGKEEELKKTWNATGRRREEAAACRVAPTCVRVSWGGGVGRAGMRA